MSARLLHITNAGGYGRVQIGGAERGVAELLAGLAATHHFDLHLAAPDEFFRRLQTAPEVTRWRFEPYERPYWQLRSIIRQVQPDVVVTHLLRASLLGQIAAAESGVPKRVSILHNSLTKTLGKGGARSSRGYAYRVAFSVITRTLTSVTVAISDANVRDLITRDRIPPERIRLIPNWCAPEFDIGNTAAWRREVRAEFSLDEHACVVGVFGRIEPQKRQGFLIEMLPSLEDVVLLVVGEGNDLDECRRLAAALGVERRVRFVGFRPDVARFQAACDVTAVPSSFEGFGRVAVESMAVGTPVVASNVDGLPHVLGDAPAGGAWLVDADDRQAWRMAIREALSRRRDARLGELLSNFAHSRFGYEQAISQWDMLLSELAAT